MDVLDALVEAFYKCLMEAAEKKPEAFYKCLMEAAEKKPTEEEKEKNVKYIFKKELWVEDNDLKDPQTDFAYNTWVELCDNKEVIPYSKDVGECYVKGHTLPYLIRLKWCIKDKVKKCQEKDTH